MFSVLTNMVIIYVDIILMLILLGLVLSVCTYCVVRVRRLQRNGHITVLLKPTKVLFSHKNEEDGKVELRTVVAYQNPFTGDYCIHKSRPPQGYLNALPSPESTDSGVSEEYEPLKPMVELKGEYGGDKEYEEFNAMANENTGDQMIRHHSKLESVDINGVNKTMNWNYKEYQI